MTSKHSFLALTEQRVRQVEDLIREQSNGFHPGISEALNILLSSGGKRLRPVTTLLVGDILQADQDDLLTLAAAIELLHTATLVHDDLIDASMLRRGSPTLNAKWSPGATVLTGDFLFARAAFLATQADSITANRMFAETLSKIVNGELNQMLARELSFSHEEYNKRIEAKTAALFQTSSAIVGTLVDITPEVREAISAYGYHIGMAFQLMDDILDFTSDAKTLGKPVGNDLSQGIITLPVIHFSETHPAAYSSNVIAGIIKSADKEALRALINDVTASGSLQQAFGLAKEHVAVAIKHLDLLPETAERDALRDLALYVVDRKL